MAASRSTPHTHPNTPARSGGAHPKPEPKHTHQHRTPGPGVAGYKLSAHTGTHTPQHPSQEWWGAAKTRAQAHTPTPHSLARSGGVQEEQADKHTKPNTPAKSGKAQPKPDPKHTHPHSTAKPGVAGYKQSAHTSTHTPHHPRQEWRGATETRVEAHTPRPHTPSRSGGVHGDHAHKHAHHNTRVRNGGAEPKPQPKHTHPYRTPEIGVAG